MGNVFATYTESELRGYLRACVSHALTDALAALDYAALVPWDGHAASVARRRVHAFWWMATRPRREGDLASLPASPEWAADALAFRHPLTVFRHPGTDLTTVGRQLVVRVRLDNGRLYEYSGGATARLVAEAA